MKVLHADSSKRIVLPSPVKPHSAWVPVLVTEKEIHLVAFEPPKEPPRMTKEEVKRALKNSGLRFSCGWDDLKAETR